MKNLGNFFAALALTLALTLPAAAGVIDCPIAPTTEGVTADSAGQKSDGSGEAETDGSLMGYALSLIEGLLSLF